MQRRVLVALQGLLTIPRTGDIKKIAGSRNEYRLRVGGYRVLFDVDQDGETITVTAVRHRSSAYDR